MTASVIGQPLDRVDGRLKITGAAKYAADPAERLEAQYVIPRVIAINTRNITSEIFMIYLSPLSAFSRMSFASWSKLFAAFT